MMGQNMGIHIYCMSWGRFGATLVAPLVLKKMNVLDLILIQFFVPDKIYI